MTRIRTWYRSLPNETKAAFTTALVTFLSSFALQLLGFLADVQEWLGDTSRDFPEVSPVGKAVASALVGAVAFLLNYAFRRVRPAPQYPGSPPNP